MAFSRRFWLLSKLEVGEVNGNQGGNGDLVAGVLSNTGSVKIDEKVFFYWWAIKKFFPFALHKFFLAFLDRLLASLPAIYSEAYCTLHSFLNMYITWF